MGMEGVGKPIKNSLSSPFLTHKGKEPNPTGKLQTIIKHVLKSSYPRDKEARYLLYL